MRKLLPILFLLLLVGTASANDPYYYRARGGDESASPLGYGDTALTFIAGMGSRTGTVFAAAPIVQGKADGTGTGDQLSFARGTAISGNFYPTFDATQGCVSFWITPEWDSDDGVTHELVTWSGSNAYIRKTGVETLRLKVADGVLLDVSVSWSAGTTYHVVGCWDSQNTLDGTNYLRLSINDTHSFGRTTAFTPATPTASLWVGSSSDGLVSASALIEGLTVYRRVLWDGTYGENVGNGDEINLIYNGGTGTDPTLVTGAWGVTFALPTDSTPAKWAASETGEAWSMPHSSNVITPTDGFFVAGMGNWADYGTPTASGTLTATSRIFLGGAYVEVDAADEGISINKSGLTPGADYVLRGIASAVSGDPDVDIEVYDVTNAASITNITDTTTGTRTAPNVLGPISFELPTDCVEIQIRVTDADGTSGNQFAVHQVEVYENLVDNPSFDRDAAPTSVDPWVPAGWTSYQLDASDTITETTIVHSGANSVEAATSFSTSEGLLSTAIPSTQDAYFATGAWISGDGTALLGYGRGQSAWTLNAGGSASWIGSSSSAGWVHTFGVARADSAAGDKVYIKSNASASGLRYADDIYAVALDAVSLTTAAASEANSAEGAGLRVDGWDSAYQTASGGQVGFDSGWYRWTATPRHDAADAVKFGNSNAYIAEFYGDANDYIRVYWSSANTITLDVTDAGDSDTGTWDATGAVVAGTDYLMEVQYYPWGAVFRADGVDRITVTDDSVFFGTKPTAWYLAGRQTGASIGDMVISAP